ncbi:MAG: hypothetical protein ACRCYU_10680 [Nocardioides sp.]
MSRISTFVPTLLEQDPSSAVSKSLPKLLLARESLELLCCQPGCGKPVDRNRQGRVQRFCSNACRARFSKTRQRIVADLKALELLLAKGPCAWAERTEVEGTAAMLKGELARYRPFEQ